MSCVETWSGHLIGAVVFDRKIHVTLRSTLSSPAGSGPWSTVNLPYFPCTSGLLPGSLIDKIHPAAKGQGSLMMQPTQVSLPGHKAGWRRVKSEYGRGDGFSKSVTWG